MRYCCLGCSAGKLLVTFVWAYLIFTLGPTFFAALFPF